jgi:hypothetical protein
VKWKLGSMKYVLIQPCTKYLVTSQTMIAPKATRKKTREAISTGAKRRPKNPTGTVRTRSRGWLVVAEYVGCDWMVLLYAQLRRSMLAPSLKQLSKVL